jgi:tetratricopeptide (TPR) repeat protein
MQRILMAWMVTTAMASLSLRADEAESFIRAGLAAEARLDPRASLEHFRAADAARPNDPFILQKISRQLSDQTPAAPSLDEKAELARQALAYAQRAVAADPNSAVNVLSLAICYGKLGLYGDTRTRVEYSRLVHQYAEAALALNPDYDWAHHVLGRWHLEVTELGATKRFVVRLVYGGLPRASLDEAVSHLERAVALAPGTIAHHLELGLAYLAQGRRAEGLAELEPALRQPLQGVHDVEAKARAQRALAKLAGGRERADRSAAER